MKVTLKQPHTHEGIDLQAGAEIDVNEHDAAFLVEHGVIDEPAPAKSRRGADTEVK